MQYHQSYGRPDRAAPGSENSGRTGGAQNDDVLWFDNRPTDDPAPAGDPQSGDVTDGSVDYFDFNWGEEVPHNEDEMEPRRFSCEEFGCGNCGETGNSCGGCNQGGCGDDCSCNGNGCEEGGCGGNGGNGGCADNSPRQVDGNAYEIINE